MTLFTNLICTTMFSFYSYNLAMKRAQLALCIVRDFVELEFTLFIFDYFLDLWQLSFIFCLIH